MASVDSYFSVLALFILFRETIEASIICGVLLQFLNRSKPSLKKSVWYGVAAGVGISIIFGVIFIAVYYTAKNNLFSGKKRDWFKGIISWIAGVLIGILGFAMLRFLGWEVKWKRKLAAAMAKKVPDVAPVVSAGDAAAETNDNKGCTVEEKAVAGNVSSLSDDTNPTTVRPSTLSLVQNQSSVMTSSTLSTSSGAASALGPDGKKKAAANVPPDDTSDTNKHCSPSGDGGGGGGIGDNDKDVEAAAAAVAATRLSTSNDTDTDLKAPVAASSPDSDLDVIDRTPPTRRESLNIFFLVFTTVVREGIESVVFLGGLANVKITAIPLPAFVGILCGCLVGVFLYYSGKQVKHIKWLIITMAIIIFFIAAGQISIGADALMRAGAFGECSPWLDLRPWYMKPMYDWSHCCADTDPTGREPVAQQNRQRFFALARAIFGYQDQGTPLELFAYSGFWCLVLLLMSYKTWQGSLLDADWKHKRQMKEEAKRKAREKEEEAAREAAAIAALEGGMSGNGGAAVAAGGDWNTAPETAKAMGGRVALLNHFRNCTMCNWKPSFWRR